MGVALGAKRGLLIARSGEGTYMLPQLFRVRDSLRREERTRGRMDYVVYEVDLVNETHA